jgi:hypothetical protein
VIDVLKFVGIPGSIPFLVVCLVIGAGLFRLPRARRIGAAALVAVPVVYVLLSLPPAARAISGALPVVREPKAGPISTLVVLDGDNRRGRVREVRKILALHRPSTVWVLGGRWIVQALTDASVAGPQFRYDANARTTREQMDQIDAIVRTNPDEPVAVIASRLQAPRLDALIRKRAQQVTLFAAPVDDEPVADGPRSLFPSYDALRVSRDAIYEHAALIYYRARGWTR